MGLVAKLVPEGELELGWIWVWVWDWGWDWDWLQDWS